MKSVRVQLDAIVEIDDDQDNADAIALVYESHIMDFKITHMPLRMDAAEAFQVVLDLARTNIIDERENPEESTRQTFACDIIEDIATNQYADE